MKICPICQQKYADSLQFCLSDGTVLSVFNDPQATLRLETRQTQPPTQVKRGLTVGVLVLAGVGLIGLIFVVGVLILYRTWTNQGADRKSTRLNSSHTVISYAVFCLKKKRTKQEHGVQE